MEINFFRLAVYKSWRRQDRLLEKKRTVALADVVDSGADATNFCCGGRSGEEANTITGATATMTTCS